MRIKIERPPGKGSTQEELLIWEIFHGGRFHDLALHFYDKSEAALEDSFSRWFWLRIGAAFSRLQQFRNKFPYIRRTKPGGTFPGIGEP